MLVQAAAAMEFSQPNELYNLGEKPTVNVSLDKGSEGIFKADMLCNGDSFTYFLSPVNNLRQSMEVPGFKLSAKQAGSCKIAAKLESYSGEILDEGFSNSFEVSSELDVIIDSKELAVYPGDTFEISGEVSKPSGRLIGNYTLLINYNDSDYASDMEDLYFSKVLKVAKDDYSGKHYALVIARDDYGNKGEEMVVIDVMPNASRIGMQIDRYAVYPDDMINIIARLYDQSNTIMKGNIMLKIVDSDGAIAADKVIESNYWVSYRLDKYAVPGKYSIIASYGKMNYEDFINVEKVERLDIRLNGSDVIIKNIGNVDYDNTTNIILEKDGKKYVLARNVKLVPSQETTIDLRDEVPDGIYSVSLPEEDDQPVVEIIDNRSFLEKTMQGLRPITGSFLNIDEMTGGSVIVIIVVLVAVAVIIAYIYRDRLPDRLYSRKDKVIHKDMEKYLEKRR